MKQFDYRFIDGTGEPEDVVSMLKENGKSGWHVISYQQTWFSGQRHYTVLLEKEVVSE